MKEQNPRYKVAVYINIPSSPHYYPVPDPRTGLILIDYLAQEHLVLDGIAKHHYGVEVVASNVFSLLEFNEEEGAYMDWDDEHGNTIDQYELNENLEMVLT